MTTGERYTYEELGECADALFERPAVADVAVISSPSDEWGETPKAFVVPTGGDPADPDVIPEELEAFCRDRVADFKVVRRFEFVDELPRTATGKVQKFELRQEEWVAEDGLIGKG